VPHEIITKVSIAAAPERVWSVLTDFPRYREWNPFIQSIEGSPAEGAVITVRIQPPRGRGMTFSPVVLRYLPSQELRWKGKLVLSGVFDGEHYFRLTPEAAGSTALIHGERFTGLLVPLLRGSLDRDTRSGFEAMNRALKQRVEQGVGDAA
jgi:hypothetical protein